MSEPVTVSNRPRQVFESYGTNSRYLYRKAAVSGRDPLDDS